MPTSATRRSLQANRVLTSANFSVRIGSSRQVSPVVAIVRIARRTGGKTVPASARTKIRTVATRRGPTSHEAGRCCRFGFIRGFGGLS